jgi:hypothetical protein
MLEILTAILLMVTGSESTPYESKDHEIYALHLIQLSPEVPISYDGYDKSLLAEQILKKAVELQILDPKETKYSFLKDEEYDRDILYLRERWMKLKDAPRIEDFTGFPTRDQINESLNFNKKFMEYLVSQQGIMPEFVLRYVMQETKECADVWTALSDAKCGFYYVPVKRAAMLKYKKFTQNIKDENGGDYWTSRRLPPSFPYWRFRECD